MPWSLQAAEFDNPSFRTDWSRQMRFNRTLVGVVVLVTCTVSGCSRQPPQTNGGQMTQLTCGSKTYRVATDRIDGEVNDACQRANVSAEALRAYRAAISRFTCQESNGHVTLSLLAPRSLFDEYEKNCRQYLSVEDAFHNRAIDLDAYRTASRDFTARNNELARRHGQDDNALFRERAADQASLSRLIKNRGGSIEITN
jgi:hypothetical protein